ncbi:hypothetical protein [Salinimicrobium flavum]|uniref:Uncharacterized protein n=1 Tax=Salinimicrobium flavum TaxID=1737065 RepID=A0ABW5IZT4_9FLAO
MEKLNNFNLLHSNIIIGMHANVNLSLTFTEDFNKWLHHKDNDWGMEDFKSRNTLYVGFLHIIDLSVLKQIFYDLASIYKKQFPYAEKQAFIDYTFGFTIVDIERFISRDFGFLGSPTINSPLEYYYCSLSTGELIDFAIPKDSSIEHYKQYYRQAINLINNIPYNTASPLPFNCEMPKMSKVTDQSESEELQNTKSDNNQFSVLQWATIFYYVDESEFSTSTDTKINRMEQFMKEQSINTTLNNFKKNYYEAKNRINKKNDYPIRKLEPLIQYMEDNYPTTVNLIETDLRFLEEENDI